ncbi:hypothetical protein G3M48_003530 [Beauveria asiatica]|uniref:Heat-labile enterotoxin IIA, A chain n=1 Tax=Beauveria asiatica TaxID=1069075 RepID=A0AAW0RVF7_9HYPO
MMWLPWSPLGCVAAFFAVLDVCQAHNPKDNPEYYVFRGDSRSPEEIRDAGGFLPDPDAASYSQPTTFSLDNHVNGRTGSTAYVSTSAEFGQAARNFAGPGNFVYRIHVTPNMINVNEALARSNPYPRQEEASALGGIPWTAVEGWLLLEEDPEFETSSDYLDDASADRFTARYAAEFADQFEPNRAYDDSGLGGPARQTRADPQVALLAAQPPDEAQLITAATTFMNNHAVAVGWTENQAFPYAPPTPPASAEPVAMESFDVANISGAEMEDLTEGRFDNLDCPELRSSLTFFDYKMLPQRDMPRAATISLNSRDDKKGIFLHSSIKTNALVFSRRAARVQGRGVWPRPKFNDKVASLVCDPAKPRAAPTRWEWTSQSQKQLCSRLDKLSLEFKLANSHGSGTYDKIKLGFEDAGQKAHVITEGPSPGYETSQDINIQDVFGLDTVALAQIKRVRLLDELTDWTFGGDAWDIIGFTLKGRCAGSGINIALDKFSSLNKELQAHPDVPGRFQYNRDWEVWADNVKPHDWVAKPLCSHFQSMSVNLHIADANWAGTDNSLYAKVGKGRFLITRHPSRREVFTTDISVNKAYETKHVPVTDVASVGISSEGGHDGTLPEEVTVYGICSGTFTALSVKQEIKDWLYDGQTVNIALAPHKWVKV